MVSCHAGGSAARSARRRRARTLRLEPRDDRADQAALDAARTVSGDVGAKGLQPRCRRPRRDGGTSDRSRPSRRRCTVDHCHPPLARSCKAQCATNAPIRLDLYARGSEGSTSVVRGKRAQRGTQGVAADVETHRDERALRGRARGAVVRHFVRERGSSGRSGTPRAERMFSGANPASASVIRHAVKASAAQLSQRGKVLSRLPPSATECRRLPHQRSRRRRRGSAATAGAQLRQQRQHLEQRRPTEGESRRSHRCRCVGCHDASPALTAVRRLQNHATSAAGSAFRSAVASAARQPRALRPHSPHALAAAAGAGGVGAETRTVRVPPHRYTPLKEAWEAIVKPIVEHAKLQVRMNTRSRAVEIRSTQFTTDVGALQVRHGVGRQAAADGGWRGWNGSARAGRPRAVRRGGTGDALCPTGAAAWPATGRQGAACRGLRVSYVCVSRRCCTRS